MSLILYRSFAVINIYLIIVQSVQIDYPANNNYIEERFRSDWNTIDPLLRYYVVPREIQFRTAAIQAGLPYFLRCQGSKRSINFTVPPAAAQHLILKPNDPTKTVTATLRRNKLINDLVGRYTCSEMVNNKLEQTTVYVFIYDGKSVFTKKQYPAVFKQRGIHFFNLPCQATNWYSRLACPTPSNSRQCRTRSCTPQEYQNNELKCNMPICDGQEPCIPVYYTPVDPKPEKVLFDPQIGFALVNPSTSETNRYFSCLSSYTPSQSSRVPFDASEPGFIEIHQPSLSVTKDETLKLTCEIQYTVNVDRRAPTVFWFEDVHNLTLVNNETEKAIFQLEKKFFSQNASITVRGFKPNQVYRFYCVRVSDQGLYSRSVDITCVNEPTLDIEISSGESDANDLVPYGSDSVYYISVLTIPRSALRLELSRNNVPLLNDKRFVLAQTANQENQFFEYTLTIYNVTFEDTAEIKLVVKSSVLEKTKMIRLNISGEPIGQLAFLNDSAFTDALWRESEVKKPFNINPYGIPLNTRYRISCNMRHRSDMKQPLEVSIHHFNCTVDTCLTNTIDKTCQRTRNLWPIPTVYKSINSYQTNWMSVESYRLHDPSMGHQFLCCYRDTTMTTVAKAIAVASTSRDLFHVQKPEFTLVKGDVLVFRCQAHQLIYGDLRIVYNDGYSIYETRGFDQQWRLRANNQIRSPELAITSVSQTGMSIIEVRTPPLARSSSGQILQCIAQSRRPDIFPDRNETYVIRVDDPIPLQFKADNLPSISKLERKSGDNVVLDCTADGRPQPRILWYKGKLPLVADDSTVQFGETSQTIVIKRAQPVDTGYYTCELHNGRDPSLKRSFDLRIKGNNPYSRIGRLITAVICISALLLVLMLTFLVFLAVQYLRMKKKVNQSIFHDQPSTGPEDPSQSALSQLTRMRLPDNFASSEQINTLLSYANGDATSPTPDDFKELGRGQFGVVYQVRLPDVDLVAAKLLPENIRRSGRRRDKRKKSRDLTNDEETALNEREVQKRKAAEMLIDEIKVMHKAGKHVNIVALKKVAYPVTKVKFLFAGGPIRDEDSFYLMELCSNGSLESMLKRFLQSSTDQLPRERNSLYQVLSEKADQGMSLSQACDRCQLTDDDLKLIAYQVACGVDYLNRRQIAHCDIAARNVLVNARFIMKICDFGLATWTTYKNYREQLARHETVQLEKKTNDIATHNLTPELGRAFLNPSNPDERLLLNKASIKADVWSFGIFLWSLFLKSKLRPFYQLSEEVERSGGGNFFYRLAHEVSEGHVLRYINYQPEIPHNIYALIQLCLAEEAQRPEMTRVRALLCHSKMLSKRAFEYYRLEYNRYQEENATEDMIERFGDEQGVADLPTFDGQTAIKTKDDDSHHVPSSSTDDGYYPTTDDFRSSDNDGGYLPPKNPHPSSTPTTGLPDVQVKKPTAPASPKKRGDLNDSYM